VELLWALESFDLRSVIDILIVAFLFFGASMLFRGTQAVALLRGTLLLIVVLVALSALFQLQALGWVISNLLTVVAVAIPVIFQPELRRALEQIGRGSIFNTTRQRTEDLHAEIVEEICQAVDKLSERRHGALIVLERESTLGDFVRTGIPLHAQVTSQLLLTVFWPKTELHDGAVIISRDGRIAAAGAVLPLTASRNLPNRKMGTRHRAALGISEVSDAICVLVSEETGRIALTQGGRIVLRLEIDRLRSLLESFYNPQTIGSIGALSRLRLRVGSVLRRKPPKVAA
jgi:diadenylate cyclase